MCFVLHVVLRFLRCHCFLVGLYYLVLVHVVSPFCGRSDVIPLVIGCFCQKSSHVGLRVSFVHAQLILLVSRWRSTVVPAIMLFRKIQVTSRFHEFFAIRLSLSKSVKIYPCGSSCTILHMSHSSIIFLSQSCTLIKRACVAHAATKTHVRAVTLSPQCIYSPSKAKSGRLLIFKGIIEFCPPSSVAWA